jgi:hypothetical protein
VSSTLSIEVAEMDETRRDDEQQGRKREASSPSHANDDHRDELAQRRAQQNRPSLTRNEQQERWPIG